MSATTTETHSVTARNFRTPDERWEAASQRAKREGTNVSAVLNRFLEAYIADGEPETVTMVSLRVTTRGGRVVSAETA